MSLAEVRAGIDAVDDRIVELLAQRQQLVQQAATFKRDADAVRAPERRRQVVDRLRARASAVGADPRVVEVVATTMIDAFIELELRAHRSVGPS
jgi:isochorismate pyruvate lyase